MKDRIQKLCKRLNKFTLEEISLIVEIEELELKHVIQELIKENILTLHDDNNYIYNHAAKSLTSKKRLPLMFEYQSVETIEMFVKCFCAEISSHKAGLILKPQENCICSFYVYFREQIFENQKQELINHFKLHPQKARLRTFFDKTFYFYYYDNYLYISDKLLKYKNEQPFAKDEIREFKKLYSILTRRVNYNYYKRYVHCHIAEQIWRYEKDFDYLRKSLLSVLFS